MNKEETKNAIEVMQAFVDGKKIQCMEKHATGPVSWRIVCAPWWDFATYTYRIKPEPKIILVSPGSDDRSCGEWYSEHYGFDASTMVKYVRLSDVELLK